MDLTVPENLASFYHILFFFNPPPPPPPPFMVKGGPKFLLLPSFLRSFSTSTPPPPFSAESMMKGAPFSVWGERNVDIRVFACLSMLSMRRPGIEIHIHVVRYARIVPCAYSFILVPTSWQRTDFPIPLAYFTSLRNAASLSLTKGAARCKKSHEMYTSML